MSEPQGLASYAIALEQRGEAFYRRAAEQAADPEVRETFRRLAEDEQEHARHFQLLLQRDSGPPGPEVKRYLQAVLADPGTLFPSAAGAAAAGDARAAVGLAIQAEKDSILLYQELYSLAATDEERAGLARLLQAEKLHLLELRDLWDGVG